ncbi:hypothetical protein [Haloarcula salinisoli]|uniref:hypothetical protein n=1 Tax=Haloarcula salinisoli TaxID=2487746 RepID=UPI001C738FB9|nr:hypothetical protein [Halomicroarcula salinisoli]MBX0288575.1 hypothetical protein [Halomicroarcula salinisoli]
MPDTLKILVATFVEYGFIIALFLGGILTWIFNSVLKFEFLVSLLITAVILGVVGGSLSLLNSYWETDTRYRV